MISRSFFLILVLFFGKRVNLREVSRVYRGSTTLMPDGRAAACKAVLRGFDSHRRLFRLS